MARTRPARYIADDTAWRSLPACSRALIIRGGADHQMLAIERQHERIQEYGREVFTIGLLNLPTGRSMCGLIDADFFLLSVRRLRRVCDLARRSSLPTASLRVPIRRFEAQVETVTPVRDFFEHFDEATIEGRTGLGLGTTPDQMTITYAGAMLDTQKLLTAARQVHRAIRAVVDPIAFADVHYQ
ncbi:MAG: hypothetical protein ACRDNS_06760, partial [Trebonia sp.]